MPGLFANTRVKAPGHQAPAERWERGSTASDALPEDVNPHFQGTALLKGWWFSEGHVICGECIATLS